MYIHVHCIHKLYNNEKHKVQHQFVYIAHARIPYARVCVTVYIACANNILWLERHVCKIYTLSALLLYIAGVPYSEASLGSRPSPLRVSPFLLRALIVRPCGVYILYTRYSP